MKALKIYFAGDLFDTKRLTTKDIERVIGIISSHPRIDFLYLFGNHEKNALIESGRELPENLKIFDKEWTYFKYGNLNEYMIHFVEDSAE